MKNLHDEIQILTAEEAKLLQADKLPKRLRKSTGLYLVCKENHYEAYDYAERQSWLEVFSAKKAPQGWSKTFSDPLSAIDWLFLIK